MHRVQYTREMVLDDLRLANEKSVSLTIDERMLTMAFGFKRMDGIDISLKKLTHPSASEESLQTLPPMEMKHNFEAWCREQGIRFEYRHNERSYILFYNNSMLALLDGKPPIPAAEEDWLKIFHEYCLKTNSRYLITWHLSQEINEPTPKINYHLSKLVVKGFLKKETTASCTKFYYADDFK